MSRQTQIIAGLVVLAGLGTAVYFKAKEDQKIGTSQTTSAELPDFKATDDVDKISITNGSKGDVVLEKKGDKWEVTKPVTAAANQSNVKSLLDNMKELKGKEVIVATANDDSKKEYDFTPEKAVHVLTYKGADKKMDATFGKSGARGQMAMLEGKPGIYTVSGYSSYLYGRELKGWRDTEVFKFDDANANQITIAKKDGTLSITKGGDHWAATYKDKALPNFDEEKVKDALRAFKSLNAEDFGDGKSPAETGLDEPDSKVTIQLKDNAGTYSLALGKSAVGQSRYAQKNGEPTVYVISSWASDWANAEPSKFQKPMDGGAPEGGAPKKDGGK